VTKVDVIQLEDKQSIEDVVLYPKLLRDAIVQAAKELVDDSIRKFKTKVDIESITAKLDADLKSKDTLTLGRAIQEVSKTWFDGEEEPISKLHVARIYDQLVEALPDNSLPVKTDLDRAKGLATDLNKKLGLPEKTARETVTE
jgi:hypothetical protein